MMKYKIAFLLFSLPIFTIGQEESKIQKDYKINYMAFADIYYFYDFHKPNGGNRQDFFYNHNRQNEFNLNLALFKLNLEAEKYRANIAVQGGTYVVDNYAAEDEAIQYIHEANVGLSLDKSDRLWIDAGIFSSHMGFESAVSTENYTLSRSLAAENSPYYSAGAILSYQLNKKLMLKVLALNGWQRIKRVRNNSLMSFGSQLIYQANEKTLINWSTFIGTDDPDNNRRMRYFSNLFVDFKLGESWKVLAGFDYGLQDAYKNSNSFEEWYCTTVITQYTFNEYWKSSLRVEYFEDNDEVIVSTVGNFGFKTSGASLNLDYMPNELVQCRLEGRFLNSPNPVFNAESGYAYESFCIGASIALKLNGQVQ